MSRTRIEWATHVWNPVTGCTPVSEGCEHCWAKRMAKRLAGRCGYPPAPHEFDVTLHMARLFEPLRWPKDPRRRVFVCSMGDLFHPSVQASWVDRVLEVIGACPQHTFYLLTKRAKRIEETLYGFAEDAPCRELGGGDYLPNLWVGVSVENQDAADRRIHHLAKAWPGHKFISAEPLLGPVDLTVACDFALPNGDVPAVQGIGRWIEWVIVGGETGPGARPMHSEWVRSLRGQCVQTRVPFFFKGWGEWAPNQLDSPDLTAMSRVGKRAAGRLLDGRESNEVPE